jgi:hypothetical protein
VRAFKVANMALIYALAAVKYTPERAAPNFAPLPLGIVGSLLFTERRQPIEDQRQR